MILSCLTRLLLSVLYTNLSHLTTRHNLFLFVLFCVLRVCYDVRLLHLNKDDLLTDQGRLYDVADFHLARSVNTALKCKCSGTKRD